MKGRKKNKQKSTTSTTDEKRKHDSHNNKRALLMGTVCTTNPSSLIIKTPRTKTNPNHQLKSHLVLYVKGLGADFFLVLVVERLRHSSINRSECGLHMS